MNVTEMSTLIIEFLGRHCTGMDDHDGAALKKKVPLIERCEKCRAMHDQLLVLADRIDAQARPGSTPKIDEARLHLEVFKMVIAADIARASRPVAQVVEDALLMADFAVEAYADRQKAAAPGFIRMECLTGQHDRCASEVPGSCDCSCHAQGT